MKKSVVIACVLATLVGCSQGDPDPVGPSTPDAEVEDVVVETDTAIDSAPETAVDSETVETDTAPSRCGNGKLDTAEQCDDGNVLSGDGCSASCTFEASAPDDLCDGAPIALTTVGEGIRSATISGTTDVDRHQYAGSCGGGSGKDAVLAFTSDIAGRASISVTADYPAVVYARTTCADATTESACNDAPTAGTGKPITLDFDVEAGKPTYLFLDGYGGTSGNYVATVRVVTARCGNGIVELPEHCDDGNTVAGDGCSPKCDLESGPIASTCPGSSYRLASAGHYGFAGDTTGMTKSGTSSVCTFSNGANAVYAFTSAINGAMKLTLKEEKAKGSIYVRGECNNYETVCNVAPLAKTATSVSVPVSAERTYWVYVDSDTTTGGAYSLDLDVTASSCGNGILDGDEGCDDGGTTAGDGCDASCKLESLAAQDKCPTDPSTLGAISLAATGTTYVGHVAGSTVGLGNDMTSCGTGFAGGPDAVYRLRSPIAGFATVTLSGAFARSLNILSDCKSTLTNGLCAKGSPSGGSETISFAVEAGVDRFLVIDSTGAPVGGAGNFVLDVKIVPSTCGNAVTEGGETCDDGNTTSDDGCSATCAKEAPAARDTCAGAEAIVLPTADATGVYRTTLHSGTTGVGAEHAMTGCSSAGPDVFYKVRSPIDGVLALHASAPYDISLGIRDVCANSGLAKACANDTSSGSEDLFLGISKDTDYFVVVDGALATSVGAFTLDLTITPAGCGDAVKSGTEQCDDGNLVAGDGCSATCTLEPMTGADTCSGTPIPLTTGTIQHGVVTVSTAALSADYSGTCGGGSNDAVFVVTPAANGTMLVHQTGDSGFLFYTRTSCTDPGTEALCTKNAVWSTAVVAGVPMYLFVDAPAGVSGVATLNVTVSP